MAAVDVASEMLTAAISFGPSDHDAIVRPDGVNVHGHNVFGASRSALFAFGNAPHDGATVGEQAQQSLDARLDQVDAGRLQWLHEAAGEPQGDDVPVPQLPAHAGGVAQRARIGERTTGEMERTFIFVPSEDTPCSCA